MEENACTLILDLHKADKEPVIKDRIWYRKLDERWEFWVNGNMNTAPVNTVHGVEAEINAGDVYVKFNGWPAGIFSIITGEGVIAAGDAANMDVFCDALRVAVAKGIATVAGRATAPAIFPSTTSAGGTGWAPRGARSQGGIKRRAMPKQNNQEKIPCKLTGPNGEVLFSGTTEDLKRAAADIRKGGRPALLELMRRAQQKP